MANHSEYAADSKVRGIFPAVSLSQNIIVGIAVLSDILVCVLTGSLIFFAYAFNEPDKVGLYLTAITLYSLLMVQSFHMAGLYRFSRLLRPHRQVVLIAGICLILFLVLTTCAYAMKISSDFSRVWAFSWLLVNITGVIFARYALFRVVRKMSSDGSLARKIVIYGADVNGGRLIKHIEHLQEPWNKIEGVFDDRAEDRLTADLNEHPLLGSSEDLVDWCKQNHADEVLIALPWSASERIMDLIHMLAALPVNVRVSPEFADADIMHRRTTHQFRIPMLSVLEKPVIGWGAISKVMLDYIVATLMLILLSPLFLIVILAIKLDSPGPVFFRQKRYGFNNELIDVYKFRSMYTDRLDHNAEQLTQKDDPRVTRVGAFLRRFSIDELPQILNVLTGDMSVVGPRPHAIKAKAGDVLYEDVVDQYAVRHKVKPGITGWAQVNGWRGNTDNEAALIGRLEHDLYYIDHWSVLFDLTIIFRTIFVVLRGENSY